MLNICANLSSMDKHDQALSFAQQAIGFLKRDLKEKRDVQKASLMKENINMISEKL